MDPILQNFQEVLAFIAIIAGALTTIYIFYRKVVKGPVCNFCDYVKQFFTVGKKIDYVYNELKPNSGASMKDSIKRIEENIIVLMNKHRIIVDDYHTGIVETDAEGKITWANATYLEMTDRDLRDILGNGWINSVDPIERDAVYLAWQNAMEQQRPFEEKFHITKPGGDRLLVKGFAYPIKGKERIQGYIGKIKILVEENSA